MNIYLYQNWFRGKRKMQSEENTLYYYKNIYKPKYDPNRGDIAVQKKAHKFLKSCTDPEDWAKFAFEHDLEFQVCKIDGSYVEAYLHQDNIQDITVFFLDDDNDVFMYYTFNREQNGNYFLFGICFWEWTENKKTYNDYTKFWKYIFKPNGSIKVIEWEKDAEEECVWTSKRPLNVSSNWEDRPDFGNWSGFFKLKRWKNGELDEAFKGKGAALAYTKTNYPYKALSEDAKNNTIIAIKQAEKDYQNNEEQKAIYTLENAFNNLPKPRENYAESHELLLQLINYHLGYKNFEEALRIVEKLEKYLNLDNEHMLPLYKGKVYYFSNQKQESRAHFKEFINKYGMDKFSEYLEYHEIYNKT